MCPKAYQAWIQYPDTIKNNKNRVVMSDSKTHFQRIRWIILFYYQRWNRWKWTTRYVFLHRHAQVRCNNFFVCFEQKHKEKRWWVSGSKGFSNDLTYPPSPTDGMGNSEWWHGWHPLFHLKSDRRERTITGVETDKFSHVIWMYVGTKRISVHESTWCTSGICDLSNVLCVLWSVGWSGWLVRLVSHIL